MNSKKSLSLPNNFHDYVYKPYQVLMKLSFYDKQIKKYCSKLINQQKQCDSALDAGCGSGVFGMMVKNQFPNSNIYFTDINRDFLYVIQSLTKNYKSINIGVSDISFPKHMTSLSGEENKLINSSFDIISASANIGYSDDIERSINELYDLLKPGGKIINLEMNETLSGKFISWLYGYKTLPLKKITFFLKDTDAVISCSQIPLAYFPIWLTRHCIVIQKPDKSI